jgi:phosphopantothenoylcysteine decarboxylase/phosphopantothenate--cysteine ligase
MHEQVVSHAKKADIVIKAAAVADYRPLHRNPHKLKKDGSPLSLELQENPDILAELGHGRPNKNALIVGFAAESRNHEQEARRKLHGKKADLIIVNDILGSRTGFDVETNQVTMVDNHGSHPLPLLGKEETANRIWDHILTLL